MPTSLHESSRARIARYRRRLPVPVLSRFHGNNLNRRSDFVRLAQRLEPASRFPWASIPVGLALAAMQPPPACRRRSRPQMEAQDLDSVDLTLQRSQRGPKHQASSLPYKTRNSLQLTSCPSSPIFACISVNIVAASEFVTAKVSQAPVG
ncbi:hypothetical protein G7Y89_g5217 [Cudoniella acicularis]|uniref:Uncharacterized protein n=1 Tax=Cudoniella acicularis TaxID=354080 RepID=A0A8H4W400_9HELO|nr:hypothetical protein G7Y89_g5217 [Cudoniella acicularis]